MSESRPIRLVEFDHVTLIVEDVEASRQFYVGKLGMKEAQRPDFDFPGAWFELGQTMIHVTLAGELAGAAGWADQGVKSLSRGHHFAYITDDFEEALAGIESQGIEIADGPKVRPDGARQVYVFDPDRHVIEICTR